MRDIDPLIEELRTASARPFARYPIQYDAENPASISLPYYTTLMAFDKRLRLRACAELALGRSVEAAADLKLMSYLTGSIRNDTFLIAVLVRSMMVAMQSQVIWEGVSEHRWTDAQLVEIQQRLLAENYVAEMRRDLISERAGMMAVLEYYRTKKNFEAIMNEFVANGVDRNTPLLDNILGDFILWSMPKGWFQLEKVDYCRDFDTRFRNVFDPDAKRIYPDVLESNMKAESLDPGGDFQTLFQHRFASWKGLSILGKGVVNKAAITQCICDEAAIACALERYRLAKGAYPAQLDALASAFIPSLPHEVVTGQPYHYRLIDADHYFLYSIGWDLKDNGGKPGTKQSRFGRRLGVAVILSQKRRAWSMHSARPPNAARQRRALPGVSFRDRSFV